MAQEKITFDDKSNNVAIVDRTKQVAAEDLNEIKAAINTNAEEVDTKLAEYDFDFENADLDEGVLLVEHNLDTAFPHLSLRRPSGRFEETTQIMTYIDSNSFSLDFGGDIATGTWYGRVNYK